MRASTRNCKRLFVILRIDFEIFTLRESKEFADESTRSQIFPYLPEKLGKYPEKIRRQPNSFLPQSSFRWPTFKLQLRFLAKAQ